MSQQVTQLYNSKTWIEMVKVSKDGVLSLFIGGPPEIENKRLPPVDQGVDSPQLGCPTSLAYTLPQLQRPHEVTIPCESRVLSWIFSAVPSPLPQPGALDPPSLSITPHKDLRLVLPRALWQPSLLPRLPEPQAVLFLRASINRGSGSVHCHSGRCHRAVGRLRPPGRHTQDVAPTFSPIVFRSPFVHI